MAKNPNKPGGGSNPKRPDTRALNNFSSVKSLIQGITNMAKNQNRKISRREANLIKQLSKAGISVQQAKIDTVRSLGTQALAYLGGNLGLATATKADRSQPKTAATVDVNRLVDNLVSATDIRDNTSGNAQQESDDEAFSWNTVMGG